LRSIASYSRASLRHVTNIDDCDSGGVLLD
jgi:hypothetical protein